MSADEPLSPSPQANFLDDACDGVAIPSRLRTANPVRPALPPRHARALPHARTNARRLTDLHTLLAAGLALGSAGAPGSYT